MDALLTLCGISFFIKSRKDNTIEFQLPGEQAEPIYLSPQEAILLATCLMTAADACEEDE